MKPDSAIKIRKPAQSLQPQGPATKVRRFPAKNARPAGSVRDVSVLALTSKAPIQPPGPATELERFPANVAPPKSTHLPDPLPVEQRVANPHHLPPPVPEEDTLLCDEWEQLGANTLPKIANAGLPALTTLTPPEQAMEECVEAAVQTHFCSAEVTLTRLPRGHSGMYPYVAACGEHQLFLKYAADPERHPLLARERVWAEHVGHQGLGPRVKPFNSPHASAFLTTEVLPGKSLTDEQLREPSVLRLVLPALRRLHNLSLRDAPSLEVLLLPAAKSSWEFTQEAARGAVNGGYLHPALAETLLSWGHDAYTQHLGCVDLTPRAAQLLHGDCHQRNILFDGEHVSIIDLATVCLGRPSTDLALLAMDGEVPLSDMDSWSKIYWGNEASPAAAQELRLDVHLLRIRRLLDLHTWRYRYDSAYDSKISQYWSVVQNERRALALDQDTSCTAAPAQS